MRKPLKPTPHNIYWFLWRLIHQFAEGNPRVAYNKYMAKKLALIMKGCDEMIAIAMQPNPFFDLIMRKENL